MNHRESTQVPQGIRGSYQLLAVLLVAIMTGMVLATAHAEIIQHSTKRQYVTGPAGYLPTHGAPPLRFAEVVVPAKSVEPAVVAASTKSESTATTTAASPSPTPSHPASEDVSLRAPVTGTTTVIAAPDHATSTLSILPDESRPQVRPEDILPYFQIPRSGMNADGAIIAPLPWGQPVPTPQVQSSSTYIQTDK